MLERLKKIFNPCHKEIQPVVSNNSKELSPLVYERLLDDLHRDIKLLPVFDHFKVKGRYVPWTSVLNQFVPGQPISPDTLKKAIEYIFGGEIDLEFDEYIYLFEELSARAHLTHLADDTYLYNGPVKPNQMVQIVIDNEYKNVPVVELQKYDEEQCSYSITRVYTDQELRIIPTRVEIAGIEIDLRELASLFIFRKKVDVKKVLLDYFRRKEDELEGQISESDLDRVVSLLKFYLSHTKTGGDWIKAHALRQPSDYVELTTYNPYDKAFVSKVVLEDELSGKNLAHGSERAAITALYIAADKVEVENAIMAPVESVSPYVLINSQPFDLRKVVELLRVELEKRRAQAKNSEQTEAQPIAFDKELLRQLIIAVLQEENFSQKKHKVHPRELEAAWSKIFRLTWVQENESDGYVVHPGVVTRDLVEMTRATTIFDSQAPPTRHVYPVFLAQYLPEKNWQPTRRFVLDEEKPVLIQTEKEQEKDQDQELTFTGVPTHFVIGKQVVAWSRVKDRLNPGSELTLEVLQEAIKKVIGSAVIEVDWLRRRFNELLLQSRVTVYRNQEHIIYEGSAEPDELVRVRVDGEQMLLTGKEFHQFLEAGFNVQVIERFISTRTEFISPIIQVAGLEFDIRQITYRIANEQIFTNTIFNKILEEELIRQGADPNTLEITPQEAKNVRERIGFYSQISLDEKGRSTLIPGYRPNEMIEVTRFLPNGQIDNKSLVLTEVGILEAQTDPLTVVTARFIHEDIITLSTGQSVTLRDILDQFKIGDELSYEALRDAIVGLIEDGEEIQLTERTLDFLRQKLMTLVDAQQLPDSKWPVLVSKDQL